MDRQIDWQEQARCLKEDPELFFPEKGEVGKIMAKEAVNVCKKCPVIKECLQHALKNNEIHGIWGGMSPKQRSLSLRRSR